MAHSINQPCIRAMVNGINWRTPAEPISMTARFLTALVPFNSSNAVVGTIYYDDAMLAISNSPVDYVPRMFAQELALCQRYFEKSYAIGTAPGTNTAAGVYGYCQQRNTQPNSGFQAVFFKVPKRASPTLTIYSPPGVSGSWVWSTAFITAETLASAIDLASTTMFSVHTTVATAARNQAGGHWTADSEG